MKQFINTLLFASALALPACTDDDVNNLLPEPEQQKESISFSVSDEAGAMFAKRNSTRAGFSGKTQIVARYESYKSSAINGSLLKSDPLDKRTTRTVLYANPEEYALYASASEYNTAKGTSLSDEDFAALSDAQKTNTEKKKGYSEVGYWADEYVRYWDDAFGRYGNISVYAVAVPQVAAPTNNSNALLDLVNYGGDKVSDSNTIWKNDKNGQTSNNNVKWLVSTGLQSADILAAEDLCYSNNIQEGGKNGRYVWNNGYPDFSYSAGAANEYPNFTDGYLQFKSTGSASDPGHFDKGHLIFKHALCRLSVTLVEGAGFSTSATTDFQPKNGDKTISLLKFPYSGTLNIQSGVWAVETNSSEIIKMYGGSDDDATGTYSAQMLPGYVFDKTKTSENVMQFVIDDNTYYITQAMVYNALVSASNVDKDGDKITMVQGKHYKLTITVDKTQIRNVTATLEPWVEVAGSTSVNNAHIKLSLKTTGAVCNKDIDLYRLGEDNPGYDQNNYVFDYKGKAWFGDYTDVTTLAHSALSEGKWTTPWFFESNKTYYHFRTVNKDTKIVTFNDTNDNGTKDVGESDVTDYFNITSGAITTNDPHWGAPMVSTNTTWLNYDVEKGYEAHLSPAIGSTEDQIKIQELHMTSKINVVLKTPDNGGKVTLRKSEVAAVLYADAAEYNAANGTTLDDAAFAALTDEQKTKTPAEPAVETIVKITRIAKDGTVEMGRGLVNTIGSYDAELTMTNPKTFFKTDGLETNQYTYAVVPQNLSRDITSESDDDYVGIFIQTPDANQYYIIKKLSDIKATEVSDERNQTKEEKITRWYPGHSYTYTITISKTAIDNITCTVADWVEVVGSGIDISLES